MTNTYQIIDNILGYNIFVNVVDGSGHINSNINKLLTRKETEIVERMILAHACAGIDISSQAYLIGLNTVIDNLD